MPRMASSIHPDFRDDVTAAQAEAADRETERLVLMNAAAGRAGDTERAVELAHEMLQLRLGVYKAESGPVAGAWYLIGSEYRKASRFQEAKEAIEKSLEIYAAAIAAANAAGYAGDDSKGSAILAKEELVLILEDMGQLSDAKETRLQGASTGTMVCSSTKCHFSQYDFRIRNDGLPRLFKLNELKACSGCRSVFYCSQECQKREWKRHKIHCKKYVADKPGE